MALVTLAVCVAALWLSHDAAAQRLTDRDSRGVISGVVVEAGTGDGVDRTVVTLRNGESGDRQAVVTDERGRFVFRQLPQGSYDVVAQRLGYFWARFGADAPELGPIPPTMRLGAGRIRLGEGERFQEARIALFRSGSISGRVLDDHGEPAVGRYVRALGAARHLVGGEFVLVPGRRSLGTAGTTLTDDRGVYTIGPLAPGEYYIAVLPYDLVGIPAGTETPLTYPLTYYPGVRSLATAQPVTVVSGENALGADVRLRAVQAMRLAGRVDAPAGESLNLQLRLLTYGDAHAGGTSQVASTWVQPDGSFAFPGVPAGNYLLVGSPTGGIDEVAIAPASDTLRRVPPGMDPRVRSLRGPASPYWTQFAVHVAGADVLDLVVPLRPVVNLTGRVVLDDKAVAGNLPVPTSVLAQPADPDPRLPTRRATVGAAGSFAIDHLFGRYLLSASGGGGVTQSIQVSGRDNGGNVVDLSLGVDVDLIITVSQEAILTGTVESESGRPEPRSAIAIYPTDSESWEALQFGSTAIGWERMRMAMVGSDGSFRIRGLPAGSYNVIALSDSWRDRWLASSFLKAAASRAMRIELAWGETRVLHLIIADLSDLAEAR